MKESKGKLIPMLSKKRQTFYNSLSEAERKAFDEGAYCGW